MDEDECVKTPKIKKNSLLFLATRLTMQLQERKKLLFQTTQKGGT